MSELFESLSTFPRERWELLGELGSGGQGQTFKARHVATGELAAIKRLHARHASDLKQLELFFREADVLKALAHPCIPRFLDAFVVGRPGEPQELHVAQSFVAGTALPTRLGEGPRLGIPEIVALADQLLEILTYLHTRAPPVFHRDIKPSNLIVGADGRVSLVDFGVAASGWRGTDATTIVGTPGYTAPEQFSGIVGARTDLYAVGAVLAHVVTGAAPVMDAQSGGLTLPGEVPEPLRGAILAMAAPVPARRPASAEEARALLRRPPVLAASRGAPSPPAPKPRQGPRTPDTDGGEEGLTGVSWPRGWLLELEPVPRRVDGTHASLFRSMVALEPAVMRMQGAIRPLLWVATLVLGMLAIKGGTGFLAAFGISAVAALVATFLLTRDVETEVAAHSRAPERTEFGRLFVRGETAVAEVVRLTPVWHQSNHGRQELDPRMSYRFRTRAGEDVTGQVTVDLEEAHAFTSGAQILVLYDASDPKSHRVVVVDPADRITPSVYTPFESAARSSGRKRAALAPKEATREEQAREPAESEEEDAPT